MKIFACVIAACAANPTQWLMDTWWAEANKVYSFASTDYASFAAVVDSAPSAIFKPAFEFCGGKNGVVSATDLVSCGGKIATFAGVSAGSQNFLYDFGAKYYNLVDAENTGVISFEKFKMVVGALAATNARVVMDACDEDKNGVLAGDEINKW
jgi:dihydroorotase